MICPSCGRAWVPLGEEPAECPACRHAIGMCALVGGRLRAEVEASKPKGEPAQEMP